MVMFIIYVLMSALAYSCLRDKEGYGWCYYIKLIVCSLLWFITLPAFTFLLIINYIKEYR